jgi:hypothetical protein
MKKMGMAEFEDRVLALQRARKIFIETGLTNNVTHAFEAYQEILAEQERERTLSKSLIERDPTFMDRYERPRCPTCGAELLFRQVNAEGIRTQLVCSNQKCDTVLNDEHPLQWWMDNLKVKTNVG